MLLYSYALEDKDKGDKEEELYSDKIADGTVITGSATTIDTETLTASRAMVTDGNGKVAVSDVTATEIGYLDGVTSNIQTQLDNAGGGASAIDDLTDGKSGGTNFQYSMILGHETTGTLNNANYNTAVGINAMKSITGGDDNTVLGFSALEKNTQASRSTAVGSKSLWNNNGDDNTAVGYQASYSNSSGEFNVAIGSEALYSNLTSSQNVAIGRRALYFMTSSGQYNTAIGYYAGSDGNGNTAITGGDNNVLIGHQSGVDNANAENRIVIGQGARGLADDSVVLGNTDAVSYTHLTLPTIHLV